MPLEPGDPLAGFVYQSLFSPPLPAMLVALGHVFFPVLPFPSFFLQELSVFFHSSSRT
jgi:hypothetical protein